MKKKILAVALGLALCFGMTGCTNVINVDEKIKSPNSKLCDFEVVDTNFYDTNFYGTILVDKKTNVLYYWIQGDSMTPIYNSDGTVKLDDGE